MSLRLVTRFTDAVKRIPSVLKSRVSDPRNLVQCRQMSKKKDDGTCKKGTCGQDQFFGGCFKRQERKPCVDKKQKPSICKNPCKQGPCKQGK